MAKRMIELDTPYKATGKLADCKPAVIRVRLEAWRGESRYVMNDWLSVPAWMRRLDGVTVRGLVLALVVLAALGYGLARLLLAGLVLGELR